MILSSFKKMMGAPMKINNLSPREIAEAMARNEIILVDVRESDEVAQARIAGSLLHPLSSFDPSKLPAGDGKKLVFFCAGGVRSQKALDLCQKSGLPHDSHMAGGIRAWVNAGLPTV